MRRIDPYLLVLLAFAAILLAPLTAPGYFMLAHDARHTVYFMQMFDAALHDGAIYPRWATDMTFGYGYPVWIILAPLPYYLAEFFHVIGFDFPTAVKAVEAVGLLASGVTMYGFARRVMGREAGLLAGVAYLFVPYHVVDLYVRGACAEFLAFAFLPLVLWMLHALVTTRRPIFIPMVALAYAGLILTHMQTALVFSPIVGAYVVFLWIDAAQAGRAVVNPTVPSLVGAGLKPAPTGTARGRLLFLFAAPAAGILWGLALSATFLLPVLIEQGLLTTEPLIGGFFDFRQHFVTASELLSPFWGYGYAGINGGDQFSLQLGVLPLLLALVAVWGLRDRLNPARGHILFFAGVTLAVVLLTLPLSAPIWELAAPVVAFVQFPWRLLTFSALSLAFLAGGAALLMGRESRKRAALLFSLLLVLALFPNARPQYTNAAFDANSLMDFQVKDHELLGDTVWMEPGQRPKDSPLVAQYRAGAITEKAVVTEGQGEVKLLNHRSQGDGVEVNARGAVRLMFYTRYFPGWTVTIDGQPAAISADNEQGLIEVSVPDGQHLVRTQFGDTWDRILGGVISLIALLAAMGWIWRFKRRETQIG